MTEHLLFEALNDGRKAMSQRVASPPQGVVITTPPTRESVRITDEDNVLSATAAPTMAVAMPKVSIEKISIRDTVAAPTPIKSSSSPIQQIAPEKSVITSERVAVNQTARVPRHRRRSISPESSSETESSASDLSDMRVAASSRHTRRRRKHHRHHHHRRSSRSSSDSSRSRSRRRHHHKKHSTTTTEDSHRKKPPAAALPPPQPTVAVEEDTGDCGRCSKPRFTDPLDPTLAGLSDKKRERIRNEIVHRIQSLQRRYKSEDIRLPERGIDDPVVCFRRYRRIARHLYGKQKINSYRLIVFVFTLIVQVALSILCGPAAAEYLKNEYAEISKYDSVFYEMGCRSYSPYGEPSSPESRLAWQLITPIFLTAVTYFITRYTGVPQMAVDIFKNMVAVYLKSGESTEYRTLLHDDEIDENDGDSEDEDNEVGPSSSTTAPLCRHPRREPNVHIPNLEEELPGESAFPAAVQAAVPRLVNMITSLRAQPEGSANPDASGFMGTMMGLAKAFMGDQAGAAKPRKQPTATNISPQPEPTMAYAD